jgi:uncharacterized membrane protein
MSRVIARRPFVGIISGILFGTLGMLLLSIEDSKGVAAVLFKVSAWFFLFIGVLSLSAGVYALLGRHGRRKNA